MPDPVELVVRRAIEQQRLGNALARDEIVILRRAFEDIAAQIARLDPTSVAERYRRARLDKIFKQIDSILQRASSEQYALAKRELAKVGVHEGKRAAAILGTPAAKAPIHPALMRQLLTHDPIQGKLLREWFTESTDAARRGVKQQLRIGIAEHEDIGTIMRRVRGVEIRPGVTRGSDEFTKATRRATAIARTAVNDVSNRAARMTYEANGDITEEYRYVATLDSRTSDICMGLDGQTFRYDDDNAKYPPQHINCRSTIVPILLDPVGPKGKRASADGPIPADTNYEEWLKGKDAAFQDEVLGRDRAKLFRDGKISLRDLVRTDGTSKTVDELRG